MSSVQASYHRLMSISEQDFFRLLDRALAGHQYAISGHEVAVKTVAGNVYIRICPQPARQFAMITLPVLAVDIDMEHLAAGQRQVFIKQFDKSYQRGGG